MSNSLILNREEIINDLLVLMQTKSEYSVWLPSADLQASIEDLLSRRMNLSPDRVTVFIDKLKAKGVNTPEIEALGFDLLTKSFLLDESEAKTFLDGVNYIVKAAEFDDLSYDELLRKRAAAIIACLNETGN